MPGECCKVGVIGVGPVGSIMSACLAEAGGEVIAVDLPERLAQIERDGLNVVWGDSTLSHRIETLDSIAGLSDYNLDFIVISTKAPVLQKILPEVVEAASDGTCIISAQNGVGTEDLIGLYIPPENVGRMVINYAGNADDEGIVRVNWFNPPNVVGPLTETDDPRLRVFAEMLTGACLTTVSVDNTEVKKRAFLKTILNSALMPVCCVLNLTMSEAMSDPATRKLAGHLLQEGLTVAAMIGYHYGEDTWRKCMAYLDKGGDHHPSMSVDLKKKLPTEIEFINGKILELSRDFRGLDLEVNEVFVSLIMALEVKNGTRKPDDIPDYLLHLSPASERKTAPEVPGRRSSE